MSRYQHTKIKIGNVVRGESTPTQYNNVKSFATTLYNSIPESDSDIWIITTMGDRLDTLAHQFYGDMNLWWYIAKANNLTFITLPVGTSLRIPGNTQFAIGK
jgi:nucleoid-associated protein YgaU|tara:strand:- start:439 stop:744 length:306 start_codon:yes stop_codon:yes gene_type:complete